MDWRLEPKRWNNFTGNLPEGSLHPLAAFLSTQTYDAYRALIVRWDVRTQMLLDYVNGIKDLGFNTVTMIALDTGLTTQELNKGFLAARAQLEKNAHAMYPGMTTRQMRLNRHKSTRWALTKASRRMQLHFYGPTEPTIIIRRKDHAAPNRPDMARDAAPRAAVERPKEASNGDDEQT